MQLFEPTVEEGQLHPNFKSIVAMRNGFIFDVLHDWAREFVDRDGKFVQEFQTTFNSGFWELYLFAVLKKYGMAVDFTHSRPDFCVPGCDLNIEATIASNALGMPPEHERLEHDPPTDLNAFNLRTIIRLSNSLVAKHRKYVESYSTLDHVVNRPFVVAITNFDQPYSFLVTQRPIEAVLHDYYVDEERWIASGGAEGRLEGEQLHQVFKDNGSPIELGMFNTKRYREISAVIYSSCASLGKVRALSSDPDTGMVFTALRYNPAGHCPHVIQCGKQQYVESLLDGLRVYHNPFATYPVDPSIFRHRDVFQSYFQDGDWVCEQREGVLLSRNVMTLLQQQSDKP